MSNELKIGKNIWVGSLGSDRTFDDLLKTVSGRFPIKDNTFFACISWHWNWCFFLIFCRWYWNFLPGMIKKDTLWSLSETRRNLKKLCGLSAPKVDSISDEGLLECIMISFEFAIHACFFWCLGWKYLLSSPSSRRCNSTCGSLDWLLLVFVVILSFFYDSGRWKC